MIEGVLTTDITERIEAFVAHADAVTEAYWNKMGYTHAPSPKHRAKILSDQWCKVITVEGGKDTSVYAFIALKDGYTKTLGNIERGGIYKAANFKAPAKNSRGSIFEADFGNCATPHGIVYLRG